MSHLWYISDFVGSGSIVSAHVEDSVVKTCLPGTRFRCDGSWVIDSLRLPHRPRDPRMAGDRVPIRLCAFSPQQHLLDWPEHSKSQVLTQPHAAGDRVLQAVRPFRRGLSFPSPSLEESTFSEWGHNDPLCWLSCLIILWDPQPITAPMLLRHPASATASPRNWIQRCFHQEAPSVHPCQASPTPWLSSPPLLSDQSWLQIRALHLPPGCTAASYIPSLSLSFLLRKMGWERTPTSQDCCGKN